MPVIFAPEALDDLAGIQNYLGPRNPFAAARIAIAILAACDSLEGLPHRGRPGLEPGTRELLAITPYVITYRVLDGASVEIVRIWHGAQDR